MATDDENARRLDRMGAQIEALQQAVAAIAQTHPDRSALLRQFDSNAEALLVSQRATGAPGATQDVLDASLLEMRGILKKP